jgi:hypothetical protein
VEGLGTGGWGLGAEIAEFAELGDRSCSPESVITEG